ncbi:MAG: glycoside hydrolase family 9 protein [Cytophagaceae bacterium]|nr:glycoside hydrolase family 9 protein [Cytophagaceae bacterium]
MKKFCALSLVLYSFSIFAQTIDNHIKVDQFGYLITAQKIAVISNPQTGYNSASTFSPGTGANQYQVRKISDNSAVFTGTLTAWNSGATHGQSGDKVWWFDFSSLTTTGSYYIYDATNNVRSYQFEIGDCVYSEVLKQAVRSYYYQRCGISKLAAQAGTGWADGSCHKGIQQDNDCRLYSNTNISTSKNLSGGWHDAGDYNKYVNFTWGALIDLLQAYEEDPQVWGDNYNIPESGNGIPDLLDEIKYELDWLLKMQQSNGSVLSIVGGGSASPPSADSDYRRYGPATTSATLTCAGIFALAAIQYNAAGMTAYGATLQTAAENAWTWANTNTNVTFYNQPAGLGAGEQEMDANGRWSRKLCASAFLYVLTGNATYKTYFEGNYQTHPGGGYWYTWQYTYPFESDIQDAMLYYTKASGADATVVSNIKSRYANPTKNNADNYQGYVNSTDAYRAYFQDNNYTWGSNSVKCHQGLMYTNMIEYNLDAATNTGYKNAAAGYIHYIHGVNPTAFAYISNMGSYGAENSINEFYNSWFADGSALWDRKGTSTYGPAPGFIPGGPNKNYSRDNCCNSSCGGSFDAMCNTSLITPPLNQPPQKSYRDWNTNWPQNSWEVTENGIYYNASYIRLLSHFACNVPPLGLNNYFPEEHAIHIFPNPNNGSFTLELNPDKDMKVEISVFNSVGIEVFYSQEELHEGINSKKIDLENIVTGIYYVRVTAGESIYTEKIIKIR